MAKLRKLAFLGVILTLTTFKSFSQFGVGTNYDLNIHFMDDKKYNGIGLHGLYQINDMMGVKLGMNFSMPISRSYQVEAYAIDPFTAPGSVLVDTDSKFSMFRINAEWYRTLFGTSLNEGFCVYNLLGLGFNYNKESHKAMDYDQENYALDERFNGNELMADRWSLRINTGIGAAYTMKFGQVFLEGMIGMPVDHIISLFGTNQPMPGTVGLQVGYRWLFRKKPKIEEATEINEVDYYETRL